MLTKETMNQIITGLYYHVLNREPTSQETQQWTAGSQDPHAIWEALVQQIPEPSSQQLHRQPLYSCGVGAQMGQDRVAWDLCGRKSEGWFVELGAYDGVMLSNTLMLEKQHGWTGLLIEPMTGPFQLLEKNRKGLCRKALIDGTDGCSKKFMVNGGLSGIVPENHPEQNLGNTVTMLTCTLAGVLDSVQAPSRMDFLSLDTEGNELEILASFPFDRYSFQVIIVEHNEHNGPKQVKTRSDCGSV